jgi:hypothetical protein
MEVFPGISMNPEVRFGKPPDFWDGLKALAATGKKRKPG